MASIGTRNHAIGSIYSRVKKLLNSGVISADEKPLWYDIYEAFPPKREPVYIQPPTPDKYGLVRQKNYVKPIFYKEDWARASIDKLYADFNSVHQLLEKPKHLSLSQSFIKVFTDIQKAHPDLSQEEIFEKTENIMGMSNDKGADYNR